MKQKVIIMGHNFMSRLFLVRACGKAGYEVVVVAVYYGKRPTKPELDGRSKYVSQFYYTLANDQDALIELLMHSCRDTENGKPLLIPASDFTASAIDNNLNRLQPYFHCPNIAMEQGRVVAMMDKVKQKQIADSLGIKNAKSWLIDIEDGNYTLPDDIEYPCFPKAAQSTAGGKVGMVRCDDEQSLRVAMAELIAAKCSRALIEQYLVIDREYAIVGYSDGQEVVIPGVMHLTQLAHGLHTGVAVRGQLLPPTSFEEVLEQYRAFVKATGFVGMFDIDFFECQGIYYFGEMNMRVGASGGALLKRGINIPQMLIEQVIENKPVALQFVEEKTCFCNERMAAMDWYQGYLPSSDFKKVQQKSSEGFLYDEEDMAPARAFMDMVRVMKFKKTIKRIITWLK